MKLLKAQSSLIKQMRRSKKYLIQNKLLQCRFYKFNLRGFNSKMRSKTENVEEDESS